VNFGPETAENGWRVFIRPLHFALGDTTSLTAWMLYNKQQVNFGTCYVVARAYGLEQQNAGRAQAGLCHASGFESCPAMLDLRVYFNPSFIELRFYVPIDPE